VTNPGVSYRVVIIAVAVIATWAVTAFTTGLGALALLAPGEFIAGLIFGNTAGTYVAHDAAGPAQAVVEAAVTLGMRSYVQALWCAIAFWLSVSLALGVVAPRMRRRDT
jgi:hypothetical protein